MAFDVDNMQIDRLVTYQDIEYRVVDITGSGLLLVVKEKDIIEENYPLIPIVIPDNIK